MPRRFEFRQFPGEAGGEDGEEAPGFGVEVEGAKGALDFGCLFYCYVVNGTEELIRSIDARKIERAREASMEEKMLDGPRLFRSDP